MWSAVIFGGAASFLLTLRQARTPIDQTLPDLKKEKEKKQHVHPPPHVIYSSRQRRGVLVIKISYEFAQVHSSTGVRAAPAAF